MRKSSFIENINEKSQSLLENRKKKINNVFNVIHMNHVDSFSNEKLLLDAKEATDSDESKSNVKSADFCLFEDSPFYIHRIAQTERLDEFKAIYKKNPKLLSLKDNSKQWTPIQFACSKDKVKIIDFILSKSEPNAINITDESGNSLLHIAIIHGSYKTVEYLVSNGSDIEIQNKSSVAPIHQCVVSNQPAVLELLLSQSNCNIHLRDRFGGTPLHYCAATDNLECAKVLLKYNANVCSQCNNGFYPIHLAAHNCSNKVLDLLISEGEKKGCNRMLNYVDGDDNKPLHAAVQFGNLEAVKLCLKYGSHINEIDEKDNSSAVHVASTQGSIEIIKFMYEHQTTLFLDLLHKTDSNDMTPLHKAAMFGKTDVAKFLIDKGAYIDSIDKELRTPLLLAASRNCVDMVCFLLLNGADFMAKDLNQRNFLQLITISHIDQSSCKEFNSSSALNDVKKIFEILEKDSSYVNLLNERDKEGLTIMHYSSQLDCSNFLKLFLSHGAKISIKNNLKQSPLHLAAKHGRFLSCLEIIRSESQKLFLNEKDCEGLTPLHLAAEFDHSKVVQILLQHGALIYKSYNGNNPFHIAAMHGSINCIKIIDSINPQILNSTNKNKDSALHLASEYNHANVVHFLLDSGAELNYNSEKLSFIDIAIKNKQREVLLTIISHNRWKEALDLQSFEFETPFIGIIKLSSEIAKAVMDRCVSMDICPSDNAELIVKYNFKYLNWTEEIVNEKGKSEFSPMLPCLALVKYGRTECLSHKLCETLLLRKWTNFGLPIHIFDSVLYASFLFMLTIIIVTYPICNHEEHGLVEIDNNTLCFDHINSDEFYYKTIKKYYAYEILSILCCLYSLLQISGEFYKIKIEKFFYFTNPQSFIQFVLHPLAITFVMPFVINSRQSYHFQWSIGAFVIFLAWFNLLLFMQRFYYFGIYVVMFTEILKTLFKVIFLFSILIFGFGLAFYILLGYESSMINPFISIFRTMIMMLGDTDGLNSFIIPYNTKSLHFGNITLVFLTMFIFLVPILLTNLLIGLAVGDIESIQKNAKLKRDAMQVQYYINLEKICLNLARLIPKSIFEKINEIEYTCRIYKGKTRLEKFQYKASSLSSCLNELNSDKESNELLSMELIRQKKSLGLLRASLDNQTDLIKKILENMNSKNESEDCF